MSESAPVVVFSAETDKLLPALFAFQGACPPVPKAHDAGKKDPGAKHWKFANIADVMDHIKPHLQQHGLLVLQPPANGDIVTRVYHVASGQWVEGRMPYPATERNAQTLGGAVTYVRRFNLLSTLGLAAEADDDDAAAQAKAAEEGQRTDRQQRSPQAQRAARQAAPRQQDAPEQAGADPNEATIQNVLGYLRNADTVRKACAALKMARTTLGRHPAVDDAELMFSDGICNALKVATSVDVVDRTMREVAQVKPKHAATINIAASEAKARIEAGG